MKPDKSSDTPTRTTAEPKPEEFWRVKCEVYFDVPVGDYAAVAAAEKVLNDAAKGLARHEVKTAGHRKVKR